MCSWSNRREGSYRAPLCNTDEAGGRFKKADRRLGGSAARRLAKGGAVILSEAKDLLSHNEIRAEQRGSLVAKAALDERA